MTDKRPSPLVGNEAGDDSPADPEGQPGGLRRAGRFTLKLALILGSVFLLFIFGLSLISSLSLEGLDSVRQRMAQADSILMWFRLLVIGGLIGFWYPLNGWLARHNGWSEARLQRVLEGRWMALALLLFVELILVQRLHEFLLGRVN